MQTTANINTINLISKNQTDIRVFIENKLDELLINKSSNDKNSSREHSINSILRIETEIEHKNPLNWLLYQNATNKIYWEDRNKKFTMAGIGEAYVLEGTAENVEQFIPKIKSSGFFTENNKNLKFYGGLRFDLTQTTAEEWEDFKSYRFVIPEFELLKNNLGTFFICNIIVNSKTNIKNVISKYKNKLSNINFKKNNQKDNTNYIHKNRKDYPDKNGWTKAIKKAVALFDNSSLKKIVLARKSVFSFNNSICALTLLSKIRKTNNNLYFFCFQFKPDKIFWGATPELLYSRNNNSFKSEAMAGTRERGLTKKGDEQLESELFSSKKEIREHAYVSDGVKERLNKLCSKFNRIENKKKILKMEKLQHYYSAFQGTLKPDIEEAEALSIMHPTPAVCGSPTSLAYKNISSMEPFDRGWYSGPVGWIGMDSSKFAVAIRSGLIEKNKLSLYSGAGIVKGSEPESEWNEIETKISPVLKVIE